MSYDSLVLSDGAVAYWKLDDANGAATIADSTGNGYTATTGANFASGLGTVDSPSGLSGTCLALTGQASGGTATATLTATGTLLTCMQTHDFSIEAWLKQSDTGASYAAFAAGVLGTTDQNVIMTNETGNAGVRFDNDNWTAITALPAAWTYCVFTFTTSTKVGRYYKNGTVIGSTNTFTGQPNPGSARYIGGSDAFHSWFGHMQRLAVYPSVLSSAQVTAHWNAAQPPPAGMFSVLGV